MTDATTPIRKDVGTMAQVLQALCYGEVPPPLYVTPSIARAMLQMSASRIAFEMCIDPSVVSLWRKRKRPIPGIRIQSFFGVLYEYTDFDPSTDCVDGGPQIAASPGYAHVANLCAERVPVLVMTEPSHETEPGTPESSESEPDEAPAAQLSPQSLRWCASTHGVVGAAHRRHHHGPVCGRYPGVVTSTAKL